MADRTVREYTTQAPAEYIGNFLQQGIFPYLGGFLQSQFQGIGAPDSTPYTYTGDRVAQFDPREAYGMDLSDAAIGSYRPYIAEASDYFRGAGDVTYGAGAEGTDLIRGSYGEGLGYFDDARLATAAGSGEYDPTTVGKYFDPYEERVVEQTLSDISKGLSKGDMALRDQAVSSGAYGGSRGRLTQEELAERVGRGAAETVAGIRSKGYGDALTRGLGAYESARGRDITTGGQFGGLGTGRFGLGSQAGQGIYGIGSGIGGMFTGLGGATSGLGSTLSGLQGQDKNRTMGMGAMGRGRNQALMDRAYSDFVGTYNLPMTTLGNVGSVVSALGPMAGGYGFAGSDQDVALSGAGSVYAPARGQLPGYGNVGIRGPGYGGPGYGGGYGGGIYGTTVGTNTYGNNMPVA